MESVRRGNSEFVLGRLEIDTVVTRGECGLVVLTECAIGKVELSWFLKVLIGKRMEEVF